MRRIHPERPKNIAYVSFCRIALHMTALVLYAGGPARLLAERRPERKETRMTTLPVTRDDRPHLALDGEQDILTAPHVSALLADATAHHDRVLVDLRKVTFMDTSGLEPLIRTAQRLRHTGGVTLVVTDPRLRRLLTQAGVAELFTQVTSPDEA
jgi:anti-anti-sigma factor